jgi:hypothetical protein
MANRGWKIIWTPPSCPKFQPIELVLGGRQASCGSTLPHSPYPQKFKADLRIGFYGGEGHGTHVHEPLDIAGCWTHAKGKTNACIAKDKGFEANGLNGDLSNWVGMEQWTATAADCLDIKDLGNIDTIEANDMELEDAGSDSDSDSDSADGVE